MTRFYRDEVFKEIPLEHKHVFRYALSNYGRLMSFTDEMKNGKVLKGSLTDGYHTLRVTHRDENNKKHQKTILLYKWVAELFIPKTADDQLYVIHIDRKKDNDHVSNLKWVNYEGKMAHYKSSPKVIAAKKKLLEHNIKADGPKLTETTVMRLKKILLDPNRKTRMKILAKQFGVSEMQLYRIKSGENWGHVKVKGHKPKDETK
ncbi:NUMOD4 domain-containing protein [Flavobacterium limnosediminis]|uniref:NUMOD4 domain-containing protein n=1 Tax=Flavobacterium limnosediminis TaxID=1401027 RepID=UPI000426BFED|nr:NUMOD4 domain-containing protein [Flavobacterium limnosediminis]